MRSESVVRAIVGLIGDVADIYKHGEVAIYFKEDWITNLLRNARQEQTFSGGVKETAKWAREQQKAQIAML